MLHPLGSLVAPRMALALTLFVLVFGSETIPVSAATPAVLDPVPIDLAQGVVDGSAFHRSRFPWLAFGDAVYFTAFDPLHGRELWRSDGTEAGTFMVRDLCPGPCDGLDRFEGTAQIFEGHLYFAGNDGAFGTELWMSDGTSEGTRLVADFCLGPCDGLGNLRLAPAGPIVPFGDRLFVAATDGIHGREPWLLDRDGNLEQIVDLCPGPCSSSPIDTIVTGSGLFFVATDLPGEPFGRNLFVTDGSAEGTRRLADAAPIQSLAFGDRLAFVFRQPETGVEVWVSDGTSEGTHLLIDLCPGNCSGVYHGLLFATDEELFLSAVTDPQDTGAGLVRTDGTAEGTFVVVANNFPEPPVLRFGDEMLFASRDDECPGLWATAGTPETTRPLVCQHPVELAASGDQLFIALNRSLHVHQGLPDAPLGIQDLPRLFDGDLAQLTVLGDQVLFKGQTEGEGFEPWGSDGTLGGTRLLRNIHRAELSGAPRHLAEVDGAVLFEVFEGPEQEVQVWRADGTRDGASRFEAGPPQISPFLRHGDTLLYSSDHVRHADGTDGLWQTDGTPEGTIKLSDSAVALGAGGGFARRFFFQAYGTGSIGGGSELWVTDGHPDGTRFVADLYPGVIPIAPPMANSSSPDGFTPLGQRVIFAATGEAGRELWSSNTTTAGTILVRDICRGCSSDPRELTRLGKQVVFTATHPRLGRELWRTDGTEGGTRPVRDLRRGGLGAAPHDLVLLRGRIVFAARAATAGEDDPGESLWRTDGTLRSTRRLATLGPGAFITESLRIGRIAYFAVADPVAGPSLWISDGTRRGTRHVVTLRPEPGGAPNSFAEVDGRLLFAVDDGIHGEEMWLSNGTADGTRRLTDLAPGALSSAPREITVAGERIYFSAAGGGLGRELWSIEREALP